MTCGIYTITNTMDNRIYVGKSINIEKRLMEHKYLLRKGSHPNLYLQNSYNKRGEGNFEFELLESYDEKVLLPMEYYWCVLLDTFNRKRGYNLKLTDPNGKNRLSEETKKKMSGSNKGKGARIRVENGYVHSIETRKKLSDSHMGIKTGNRRPGFKHSKETLEKMKIAQNKRTKRYFRKPGYYHSDATKDKIKKPIIQYDIEGNFIKEWKGVTDAAKECGYSYSSIWLCVDGRSKTAHKYIWKRKYPNE